MINEYFGLTWGPFLGALLISLISTGVTIRLFEKLGWVIDPKKMKHPAHIHKTPVPKGGGIPIFLGVSIVAVLTIGLDKHLVAILAAMLVTLLVGLWDDVKSISPYWRLGVNILAAGIVVASGIGIAYISNPLGGVIDLSNFRIDFEWLGEHRELWVLADIFALLWIPALMNAINWSSGVDGQISGVVTIAAVVLGLISLSFSADITQWPVAKLAFATAGAFLGLTVYHFYPQKIMPGYSATSLAGLLLGIMSILATAKVGTLIVVLGVPLIDFVYILARRILSGRSPVWGDKGHLHHLLLKLGWGKRRVAIFYWVVTAILGVVAIGFEARIKLGVIIGVALLMGLFLICQYFGICSKTPARDNG